VWYCLLLHRTNGLNETTVNRTTPTKWFNKAIGTTFMHTRKCYILSIISSTESNTGPPILKFSWPWFSHLLPDESFLCHHYYVLRDGIYCNRLFVQGILNNVYGGLSVDPFPSRIWPIISSKSYNAYDAPPMQLHARCSVIIQLFDPLAIIKYSVRVTYPSTTFAY
jgi:hypothetical protein